MQLSEYVVQVQAQLVAASALGDDSVRAVADALSVAAEPAVRLALLGAVSAAADEVTAALLDSPGSPVVSARIEGDQVRVEVRVAESDDEAESSLARGTLDEADSTARISLRLSEGLKGRIEEAARDNGVSVNTWILQAAADGLSGRGKRGRRPSGFDSGSSHRLTGWING
jgi:HicB family